MSVEHIMTTAEIRDQFAAYEDPTMREGSTYEAEGKLFDRWLAEHDTQVASEARLAAEAELAQLRDANVRLRRGR